MKCSPFTTEDDGNVLDEECGNDVDGEDVDICLRCAGSGDVEEDGRGGDEVCDVAFDAGGVDADGDVVVDNVDGNCVCILVFTTSSGHVIVPAMPPAVIPVSISSPKPMSFFPLNFFAKSRSFS